MLLNSLTNATEDDALLREFLLKGSLYRHGVHDGIDSGIAAECKTFLQGDTQLIEGLLQFRVYLSVADRLLSRRVGIVAYRLVVYLRQLHMSPCRLLHSLPVTESRQTKFQHPLRLILLLRNEPYNVFIQSYRYYLSLYVGSKAELIFLLRHLAHILILLFHNRVQRYD